jgi:hypothetical protein
MTSISKRGKEVAVPFVSGDTECGWEIALHGSDEIVPFEWWDNFLSFVVFFKVAVPEISAPGRCLRELLFNDRFTPAFTITVLLTQSDKLNLVDEITLFRPPLFLPIFTGDVQNFVKFFNFFRSISSRLHEDPCDFNFRHVLRNEFLEDTETKMALVLRDQNLLHL